MALVKKSHAPSARLAQENYIAKIEEWNLAAKFRNVSTAPWAIILGFCGLKPEVEYSIERIERVRLTRILDHINYPKKDIHVYLLPVTYANVVSEVDIDKINTGKVKYNLVRKIRKSD
jgi:hypothetical protein